MTDVRLPDNTLASWVERQAESSPEAVFVEDARSDREITYAELAEATDAWASQLLPAEPLALVISEPLTFAVTYIALIAIGATVVPLDPKAPGEENLRLMNQAGTQTVIADNAVAWAPNLIVCDVAGPTVLTSAITARSDAGAVLLFSSGSTGERKLIRLEQSHLLRAAELVASHHEIVAGERGYNSLPLHHVNAEVVGLLASLHGGATLVLDASFHKTGFWKLMSEREVTWINAVPAIIAILASEEADGYDNSSIRFVRSASAPLSVAVRERFETRHNIRILETYGMTEGASQIVANPLNGVRKSGSPGLPVGIELRVVGNEGELCLGKNVGTVQIRGASIVRGYVGGVAADRFTADGWLDTGDQGYLDEDGYVFLVGRTDDVINRGGEKIFPREIEEILLRDRDVTEALVVPLADEIVGQVPVAFVKVEAREAAEITERLAQFCTATLPKYMRPTQIVVLDDLPRGVTGKLSRHKGAELAAQLAATSD